MGVTIKSGEEAARWEYLQARAREQVATDRGAGMLALLATPALARRFALELLESSPASGIGWLRTHTPLSLAEEIFRRARTPHARVIPKHLKILLLERILGRCSLSYFSDVRGFPGFVRALGSLFTEISACSLSAQDLGRILGDSNREREIAALYRLYRNALKEHNLAEKSDLLHAAASLLRDDPRLVGEARDALVFGFSDFTPDEEALLRAVAGAVEKTELLLDDCPAAQRFADATKDSPLDAAGRAELLQFLLDRLFGDPVEAPADAQGAIRVLSGAGASGEFELVAREIRRLVANEGLAYSDILILARSLESTAGRLRETLERFGIPVDVSVSTPVLQTPLCAALLNLAEAVTENWPRDKVLRIFRSGYTGLVPDDADVLELNARQRGIFSGRQGWLSDFEPASLRAAKQEVAAKLVRLETALQGPIPASTFRDAIREAIGSFRLVQRALEGGKCSRVALDLRALDLLAGALDELVNSAETLQIGKLPAREMLRLLREALAEQSVVETIEHPAGVRVRGVGQAAPLRAKVVFICQMVEGCFPAQPRESFFFRDEEVRRFAESSPLKLPERLLRPEQERLLFRQSVARATERLYLTHTESDSAGKPVLRSFFVDEALSLFQPESILRQRQDLSQIVPSVGEVSAPAELPAAVLRALSPPIDRTRDDHLAEAALARWAFENLPGREPIERALARAERAAGLLPGGLAEFAAKLDECSRHLDASRLDTYGTCPYRFFLSRLVGLADLREGVDPLSEGSILHSVLEELMHQVRERFGDTRFLPDRLDEIRRIARELAEQAIQSSDLREESRYRVQLLRERVLSVIERFVPLESAYQAELGAQPEDMEICFGRRRGEGPPSKLSTDEPLRIPDGDGGWISIAGMIDRLDRLPDGSCVLIDYKTSQGEISTKAVEDGKCFQLPLYMVAAQQVLGMSPKCALYVSLRKGRRGGMGLDGTKAGSPGSVHLTTKGLRDLEGTVLDWVRQHSAQIRAGQFPAKPEREMCRNCDFPSVCRSAGVVSLDEDG